MNTVSNKAANLIGSEILRLTQEINQQVQQGAQIYNLTIGDFNPKIFPIPSALRQHIIDAYIGNETNYPPADGVAELKRALQQFLASELHIDVADNELLVAGGGRPLIYSVYQAVVDPGDVVVYPTPSWNNNHYCYLSDAVGIEVPTNAAHGFMPTAAELAPHLGEASLLALCSPLNPSGTTFKKKDLEEICDLVLEVNTQRAGKAKPLYVLFDQIYWMLRADGIEHYDPVSVRPEMKPYTLFVDGISKSFAATGVRVGWSVGPAHVIGKMKSIIGHIGAWAPRAEQMATAKFLSDREAVHLYMDDLQAKIDIRFDALYNGINELRNAGLPVEAIRPEGAIYVSARFNILGKKLPDGTVIETSADITSFLLSHAQLAVVPFTAFGCSTATDWFRISVGTLRESEVEPLIRALKTALETLN